MNLQTFIRVIKSTSLFFLFATPALVYAWSIDFSRRTNQMQRAPASYSQESEHVDKDGWSTPQKTQRRGPAAVLDQVFQSTVPHQEIVILNTERGFIPSTVRVREGAQYKIVVVNVNEKARNVSFVLDSFSEHHATFYGDIRSFHISPKKEGVYTFISPETSAQGRLVVHPALGPQQESIEIRAPASRN